MSVGVFCFWASSAAIFALCAYLVATAYLEGASSTVSAAGGIGLHSGSLSGIFYFATILLSSRYPFYWKWGLFVIGFDRQLLFHRKCASLAAVCCVLHIVDCREALFSSQALTGWICYGSALFLLIFANSYFRRSHYNGIFIRSHWLFVALFLLFGWLHHAIFVQIGAGFICFDRVLRAFDHRLRSSRIRDIRLLDFDRVIKLEFEKKHFRYRAGQYVFVRFPAVSMLEFHPFSISSYPGSGNAFSLHIKSSVASDNGWTSRLSKFMKRHENRPDLFDQIRVQIEGPFGALTLRKELSRYEHVVFIGGGIGITPLDSLYNQLVTDLLDNNIRRTARTRNIDFVFTTRSRSLVTEFASRNKAWEFHQKSVRSTNPPPEVVLAGQQPTASRPEHRQETSCSILWNDGGVRISDTLQIPTENLEALGNSGESGSGSVQIPMDNLEKTETVDSLNLSMVDREVGRGKHRHIKFSSSKASLFGSDESPEIDLSEDSRFDRDGDTPVTYAGDLAVDSLTITNSTHITRIKNAELRRQYKATFPFINFKRPNVRSIIYRAATSTRSKDICVVTSGPKGLMNECKRWAAEIGVEVHTEVFDW